MPTTSIVGFATALTFFAAGSDLVSAATSTGAVGASTGFASCTIGSVLTTTRSGAGSGLGSRVTWTT